MNRIRKSLHAICSLLLFCLILIACRLDVKTEENPFQEQFTEISSETGIQNISTLWAEVNQDFPKSPNGRNLFFERITTEQGLSQNVVRTILQDSFGYIWIGTDYGLDRYDGDEFKTYKHDPGDDSSISDNHIWSLCEDSRRNIWIGTDNGLNLFDRRRNLFIRFTYDVDNNQSISSNRIRSVIEDSNGIIWIGTWGGGLNRLDQKSGEFILYPTSDSGDEGISDKYVRIVYEDSKGLIWIGTSNGLSSLNPRSEKIITFQRNSAAAPEVYEHDIEMLYGDDLEYFRSRRPIPLDTNLPEEEPQYLSNNQIQALVEDDSERKIWIGTSGGLDCFDFNTGRFEHYRFNADDESSISSNIVLSLMVDQNGTLWVGTNNGINEFDDEENNFIRYGSNSRDPDSPKNISNPIVNTIFQDISGSIWIGTSGGGINRFDYSTDFFVHNFHDPDILESVSGNMVWSFEEDSDIGYWVGSGNGIDRYNILTGRFEHYPFEGFNPNSDLPIQVYTIFKSFNADVWAGTSNGIYIYNPADRDFRKYNIGQNQPSAALEIIEEAIILDIAEGKPGKMWFATYGSGLVYLEIDTGFGKVYTTDQEDPDSISSNIVNSLLFTRLDEMFIGTRGGGLNWYIPENDRFKRYISNPGNLESISDNNINSLFESKDGKIWVATMGGLNRFDPLSGEFEVYSEVNGLPSNVIYGIVEDHRGDFWISSSNGISNFVTQSNEFKNYQFDHGLQSNEFNPGSAFISSDGMIFLGGINGFTLFRPDLFSLNPYVPPIIVSSFSQNREEVELPFSLEFTSSIELDWPRNYFEFKVSNLNFVQRDKNQIAYKLTPVDEDWIYTNSSMMHAYENLSGGSYSLLIKGSNNDGVWGNEISAFTIKINPPFWENQYLRLGGAAFLLIAIIVGVQARVHNVQRYSRILEKEVEERTRDIEKRRNVAEGLREILVRINSDLSISESLDFVACQTTRLIESPVAMIFSIEDSSKPRIIAYSESSESPLKVIVSEELVEKNLEEWADKIKKSRRIFRANVGSRLEQFLAEEQIYFRVVPIYSMKTVLGGLAVLETQTRQVDEEDLDLLKSLADQAALAMENARLRQATEEMAVISERNRIARDLHDAITQTLFSANLIAESLPQTLARDQKQGNESLKNLQELNKSALVEMRALLLELRPDVIKEISLSELLDQMAATLRGRAGVEVVLRLEEKYKLPEQVHLQMYRVAQEAITNIIKHSKARTVSIELKTNSNKRKGFRYRNVRMKISDDGIGFDKESIKGAHFGLKDMVERAEAINAAIHINSIVGKGTEIEVLWKGKESLDGGCE